MAYGSLSIKQQRALAPHVRGRVVHDLGAGSGELAVVLLALGAERVVAVDWRRIPPIHDDRVTRLQCDFSEVTDPIDVAFVSWPQNMPQPSLWYLLARSPTVVYLGKNTDGTACGWPDMFRDFLKRELLTYHPSRPNTLIVYGGALRSKREPTGEEAAAIDFSCLRSYESVEGA